MRTRGNTMPPTETRSNGSSRHLLLAQRIADAPHRMNELGASERLDLRSQLPDKHVEGVVLHVAIMAPDRFDQTRPCQNAAGISHEQFQKYVLRSGQRDGH